MEKLKQNLLFRDETTKKLFVNFDPKLVRLLREVAYIEKLNMFDGSEALVIPQQVMPSPPYFPSLSLLTP